MLRENMICPVCEEGILKAKVEDLEFEYKGVKNVVKNHAILACSLCEESFSSPKESKALEKELTDIRRKIDGYLVSDDIKRIRSKFKMTQIQFANLLKVGEKNFARYESGQSTQGRSMDSLLRILDKYPYVITAINDEPNNSSSTNVIAFRSKPPKARRALNRSYSCKINLDEITCLSNSK